MTNTESLKEKALGFEKQRSGVQTFQEEGMVHSKDSTGGNREAISLECK